MHRHSITGLCLVSLRPTKTIRLVSKIYSIQTIHLDCNEIHLIKAILNTKKKIIEKCMEPIKCLSKYYFSSSNAFAFIEDLGNQINNVVFCHN